jgi:FG-GAP repeat/Trypsin
MINKIKAGRRLKMKQPTFKRNPYLLTLMLIILFFCSQSQLTTILAGECSDTLPGIGCIEQPIIEGEEVEAEESGFVRLWNGCSGTLLTNEWVLTARHCLPANPDVEWTPVNPLRFEVQMGNQKSTVDFMVPHPNADVSLVRLNSPLIMNGSTSGYRQKIYAGETSGIHGEYLNCYGYGASTDLSVDKAYVRGSMMDLQEDERKYTLPQGESAKNIAGIAVLSPNLVVVWYKDSTWSAGYPWWLDSKSTGQYSLPAGKVPDDIVGLAVSGSHVYVWYQDRTWSCGYISGQGLESRYTVPWPLDSCGSGYEYSLPEGKSSGDILAMAINRDGVNTWYRDGEVSVGTVWSLGRYHEPFKYSLPPNRSAEGIVGTGIDKLTGDVFAWFSPEIKVGNYGSLRTTTLQVIGQGDELYSLVPNQAGQQTTWGDSGGSCLINPANDVQVITGVQSGGGISETTLELLPSVQVSAAVFREWALDSLKAENFGSVVAVGDFNNDSRDDLAVGFPGNQIEGNQRSGSINIYFGSETGLEFYQTLDQSNLGMNETGDLFGTSLAAGDFDDDGIEDLAVGAPGEKPGADPRSGYVFLFKGTKSGLKPWFGLSQNGLGANESSDMFGYALAAGDFDDDGIEDLAVGAPGEKPGSDPRSGYVFLFKGTKSGLKPWSGLSQNGLGINESNDMFGYALAAGDFDGDAIEDLAIGAPGENPGGPVIDSENAYTYRSSGYVFVFKGTHSGLKKWKGLQQYIYAGLKLGIMGTFENSTQCKEHGDLFGWALAVGDFNHDNRQDLAVGAPGFAPPNLEEPTSSDIHTGAVFVFPGTSKGPSEKWDYIIPEGNKDQGDWFGASLATADFDGDQKDDLSVGAPGKSPWYGYESGLVYIYLGSSMSGSFYPIKSSDAWYMFGQEPIDLNDEGDWFGGALATGDFNNDGYADLIVGAQGQNPESLTPGAVFYFDGEEMPSPYLYSGDMLTP